MRRAIIPTVILALLLLAYFTRWQVVAASERIGDDVGKWERDTWTGQVWFRVYSDKVMVSEEPDPKPTDKRWMVSASLSWVWVALLVADLVWLFWTVEPTSQYPQSSARSDSSLP